MAVPGLAGLAPPFVAVCNHEVAGWRTAKCFQSTTRFSKVRRPTPVASPPQQERVSEKTNPTTLIFSHELPALFILRYRLEIQGRPLGVQRLRGAIQPDRLPSLLLPECSLEGEGLEMGMLRVRSPIRTNHQQPVPRFNPAPTRSIALPIARNSSATYHARPEPSDPSPTAKGIPQLWTQRRARGCKTS